MLLASTKRQREDYSPIMTKQSSVTQQQMDSADWHTTAPETRGVKQQPSRGSEGLGSCPDGCSPLERMVNQTVPNWPASFQITHSKLPIAAHRKGTSPHTTAHISCCTVTPQYWEYRSLKRRNGLWKPKLPCILCSLRWIQSFLGIA